MFYRLASVAALGRVVPGIAIWLSAISAATPLVAATRVALLQTNPKQSSDVAALVEVKLSASDKISVVERQQVEKILQEQQLQKVLSADAVGGRAFLGELLQADLLVFIQPQVQPESLLNVVISETHEGLRLVRAPVSRTDAGKAADSITRLIHLAIEKQSQKPRRIFAVPPLISDDLGYKFDHLKGAYSKLLEEDLSEQTGVLVVELEEARALAKEITLSGGEDVQRPLPL